MINLTLKKIKNSPMPGRPNASMQLLPDIRIYVYSEKHIFVVYLKYKNAKEEPL